MSEELKPCPFCSGTQCTTAPDNEFDDTTWAVACKSCGVEIFRDLEADAIAAWNTRTPPPPDAGVADGLAKALSDYLSAVRQLSDVVPGTKQTYFECPLLAPENIDGVFRWKNLDRAGKAARAALAAYDAGKKEKP